MYECSRLCSLSLSPAGQRWLDDIAKEKMSRYSMTERPWDRDAGVLDALEARTMIMNKTKRELSENRTLRRFRR